MSLTIGVKKKNCFLARENQIAVMTACFFDMDGTLIDSRTDLAATVNHTRRDFHLAELPMAEVLANVGHGAKYLMCHSVPEVPFDEAIGVFRSHYAEHMLDCCALYPSVREALEALADHGVLLGINTSKPAFAVRAILEHHRLDKLFGQAVIAGGDLPVLKPAPDPLYACAARLSHKLSPADWMVGDSSMDVECGRAAGIRTAFCTFGFGSLGASAPTVSIASLSDLLPHVTDEEK